MGGGEFCAVVDGVVGVSATYADRLRHPLWQKRRLEIMALAGFKCERCGSAERFFNVHHKLYRAGAAPWEYADKELECLCEDCHLEGHLWEQTHAPDRDGALEEAIELAYQTGITTANQDTRVSAFRVMASLVGRRSEQRIEQMEIERGLR